MFFAVSAAGHQHGKRALPRMKFLSSHRPTNARRLAYCNM